MYLDGEKQKSVETVDDDHEHLVGVDSDHAKGRSPGRMVGSTIGDQLKLADKRSRVFSIALKDRAAILLAGKNPDAVFWCDKATGRVVTSSYYSDSLPEWAGKWNKAGGLLQYAGKTWLPSLDPACYDAATNCEPAWSRTLAAAGPIFPHLLPEVPKGPADAYFKRVMGTPYGNEAIFDWAKELIPVQNIGKGPATDMLFIGLSANDRVGHLYGPESPEVLEITVLTDRLLGHLFEILDHQVGADRWLLALTADHGVTTTTHLALKNRLGGGFFDEDGIAAALNSTLAEAAGSDAPGLPLITGINLPWIFGNSGFEKLDEKLGGKLTRTARDFLRSTPGVERVFTRADLSGAAPPETDADFLRAWNSFSPRSSAQFLVKLLPYWQGKETEGTTEHSGGSHSDRHVPIVLYGPGIRAGAYFTPAELSDIAPTLAALLGIEAPPNCTGHVLSAAIQR
ncbi:MAG TPA: alkaline phosphatase family protein [Phycisphaerae bacterium]|nr:alkaline phosphatase family protein [Phycisphaerae bacterium]